MNIYKILFKNAFELLKHNLLYLFALKYAISLIDCLKRNSYLLYIYLLNELHFISITIHFIIYYYE